VPDVNELGDLEIRDPEAMLALADPARLEIFESLQRHGPAAADRFGPDAEDHLRHLASFGLIVETEEGWRTAARGIQFQPGDDAESQAAYRALANEMMRRADDLPGRWLADHEHRLEPEWRRVSGMSGARTLLTREEAEALDLKMEELLIPYVTREPSDAPEDARPVRLLRYLMPEAPS
jgi:hypothetical protein